MEGGGACSKKEMGYEIVSLLDVISCKLPFLGTAIINNLIPGQSMTTIPHTLPILDSPEIWNALKLLLLIKHVPGSYPAWSRTPITTGNHYGYKYWSPWLCAICQCPMLVSPSISGRGNRTISPAPKTSPLA